MEKPRAGWAAVALGGGGGGSGGGQQNALSRVNITHSTHKCRHPSTTESSHVVAVAARIRCGDFRCPPALGVCVCVCLCVADIARRSGVNPECTIPCAQLYTHSSFVHTVTRNYTLGCMCSQNLRAFARTHTEIPQLPKTHARARVCVSVLHTSHKINCFLIRLFSFGRVWAHVPVGPCFRLGVGRCG